MTRFKGFDNSVSKKVSVYYRHMVSQQYLGHLHLREGRFGGTDGFTPIVLPLFSTFIPFPYFSSLFLFSRCPPHHEAAAKSS